MTAIPEEEEGYNVRKKRMLEPIISGGAVIYMMRADGRYLKTIIRGHLQIPTAVITLPQLGRFCFADAGADAKIECADMDGKHREVRLHPHFRLYS